MTERVREILSWYGSENPGVLANMARLMNHGTLAGTGKMVILPVDQGFEHGPIQSFAKNSDAHDPLYHFRLAVESGCNAYAAPLGFIEAGAREFAGDIPLILKINNSDILWGNPNPISALSSGVEDALRLGCAAIGFTIYPGSGERKQMYEEIAVAARAAKAAGLAVVIWSFPRGEKISKDGETAVDVVAYAAHIAAQLGANIIKVKPPTAHVEQDANRKVIEKEKLVLETLADRVRYVNKACFNGRRVVIFSGGPAKSTEDVLAEIRGVAQGGGFGSIMGRNAFQRPWKESLQLLRETMEIYARC